MTFLGELSTVLVIMAGYTMNGAAIFGGCALRKDQSKGFRIATGLAVIFIAFSRPFLGVHTPQDVLVGIIAGLLVMWLTIKLLKWLSAHPEKDYIIVITGVSLSVLLVIYALIKHYPADYDIAGNLIVDGAKMANDTFKFE